MRVLAIDTALAACSVAITDDNELLVRVWEPLQRGHAERLLPMLEEARTAAGIMYNDLDLIAVTVGPGTFTGIRVGLAAARGLALATGAPVLGVSTLQALAWGYEKDGGVVAALDARRGELYWQAFDGEGRALNDPKLSKVETLAAMLPPGSGSLIGNGAELAAAHLPAYSVSAPMLPDAASIGLRCGSLPPPVPGRLPAPLYLREPDATLPVGRTA